MKFEEIINKILENKEYKKIKVEMTVECTHRWAKIKSGLVSSEDYPTRLVLEGLQLEGKHITINDEKLSLIDDREVMNIPMNEIKDLNFSFANRDWGSILIVDIKRK